MLRVTGGTHRGRRLAPLPKGTSVRPMPARVREAVASSLADRIPGARVLDLFAGSGIVSFELLSRGAGASRLVERDPRLARHLAAEIARFGYGDRAEVVRADVDRVLEAPPPVPFDLVVLDPPYRDAGCTMQLCRKLAAGGFLAPGGVVVSHRPVVRGRAEPVPLPDGWSVLRSRRYGQALFEFFTFDRSSPP